MLSNTVQRSTGIALTARFISNDAKNFDPHLSSWTTINFLKVPILKYFPVPWINKATQIFDAFCSNKLLTFLCQLFKLFIWPNSVLQNIKTNRMFYWANIR